MCYWNMLRDSYWLKWLYLYFITYTLMLCNNIKLSTFTSMCDDTILSSRTLYKGHYTKQHYIYISIMQRTLYSKAHMKETCQLLRGKWKYHMICHPVRPTQSMHWLGMGQSMFQRPVAVNYSFSLRTMYFHFFVIIWAYEYKTELEKMAVQNLQNNGLSCLTV